MTVFANGQVNQYFIEEYPQDTFPCGIPFCVSYSHEEQVDFGAIYHTDTIEGELQDVYESNENFERDTMRILPKDFVKLHLLSATPFISSDFKNKDSALTVQLNDFLNADFFGLHVVLKTKMYYGVIYERVFAEGMRSSEKMFCTFGTNGKFISSIKIASFIFNGTGYSSSGQRVPWFPLEYGCIQKDLKIKFISQEHGDKNYKIEANGEIIEIK
jgi:hypothetical protein